MLKKFVLLFVIGLLSINIASAIECYVCDENDDENCATLKDIHPEECEEETWPFTTTTAVPTTTTAVPTTTPTLPTTTPTVPTTTPTVPTTTPTVPTTTPTVPTTTPTVPTTTPTVPTTTPTVPTTTPTVPTNTTIDLENPETSKEPEENQQQNEVNPKKSSKMVVPAVRHTFLRKRREVDDFSCAKIVKDNKIIRGCTRNTCRVLKEKLEKVASCNRCETDKCNFGVNIQSWAFSTILLVAIIKFFV